jgi:outer membrane protein
MKKILIAFTFVSLSFFAKAQTTSGQMMLGGTVAISSVSSDNAGSDYSSFTLAPSFGYFVKDNFVVGLSVSTSSAKSGTGVGQSKSSSFGVGPFARLYKFTSNEQFAFFANAGLSFGGSRNESGGFETRTNTITFAVAPGFAYFFNEHWAAELAIAGLRIQNSKNPDANGGGTTSVTFDVSSLIPNVGIRYHFGN